MKKIFCCVLLLFVINAQAQKLRVEKGKITFTSDAPLEIIKASSEKLDGIIDVDNKQFAFLIPISSFIGFNSELQRVHFNEKYMESDKYPNATFKGKIIDDVNFLTDGVYDVRVKGELDVHGKTQTRIIKGKVTVKDGKAVIDSRFTVPLVDHNITIPRIVNEKIATEIEITVNAIMTK